MPLAHRELASGAGAALICALAILAFSGCGSDPDGATAGATTVTIPTTAAAPTTTTAPATATEPAANPSAVEASPSAQPPPETTLSLDRPRGTYAAIWVRAGHTVEMRTEPGGGELIAQIGRRTEFESPSVFGVVERRGNWAGVSTERLANGSLGWIKLDPKRVDGGWTRDSIVVDLSDYSAELRRGDRTVMSFPVTIGAPDSPTPTGRYAVTDTFTGLNSAAYGCCALALSATQPNLPSGWLGGKRIAIHGTSDTLGIAASHGCVRAADADVKALVRTVSLGTPVFIQS